MRASVAREASNGVNVFDAPREWVSIGADAWTVVFQGSEHARRNPPGLRAIPGGHAMAGVQEWLYVLACVRLYGLGAVIGVEP